MSKKINPWYFNILLGPVFAMGDSDDAVSSYSGFNPDSAEDVRSWALSTVRPLVESLPDSLKEKIKILLKYSLSSNQIDIDQVIAAANLPFVSPKSGTAFMSIIWDVCFPNERWHLHDVNEYAVRPDLGEVSAAIRKLSR